MGSMDIWLGDSIIYKGFHYPNSLHEVSNGAAFRLFVRLTSIFSIFPVGGRLYCHQRLLAIGMSNTVAAS